MNFTGDKVKVVEIEIHTATGSKEGTIHINIKKTNKILPEKEKKRILYYPGFYFPLRGFAHDRRTKGQNSSPYKGTSTSQPASHSQSSPRCLPLKMDILALIQANPVVNGMSTSISPSHSTMLTPQTSTNTSLPTSCAPTLCYTASTALSSPSSCTPYTSSP